jgi:hypothetical protein
MIEIICLGLVAVAVLAVFYLQAAHTKERGNTSAEMREMYETAMEQGYKLAAEFWTRSSEDQARFLADALGSMRNMYSAYGQSIIQAAAVVKAASAAEGVMAAGTMAQTAAAMDPELQQKMMDIQARVASHQPFQQGEPQLPKIPDIIQDPETGEILKRLV